MGYVIVDGHVQCKVSGNRAAGPERGSFIAGEWMMQLVTFHSMLTSPAMLYKHHLRPKDRMSTARLILRETLRVVQKLPSGLGLPGFAALDRDSCAGSAVLIWGALVLLMLGASFCLRVTASSSAYASALLIRSHCCTQHSSAPSNQEGSLVNPLANKLSCLALTFFYAGHPAKLS